jgi:hypothetical protein
MCMLCKKQYLTNFMELSPSLRAANCAATQELCSHFHYHVHQSPPLVPIMSKMAYVIFVYTQIFFSK